MKKTKLVKSVVYFPSCRQIVLLETIFSEDRIKTYYYGTTKKTLCLISTSILTVSLFNPWGPKKDFEFLDMPFFFRVISIKKERIHHG